MPNNEHLANQFESNRTRLNGVAYRMLGSATEAEDAVQEAWLRLNRTDSLAIENLSAWLTTAVARVCLDMLRSRKARREEFLGAMEVEPDIWASASSDPAAEAEMADSVGLALLVVLETLAPPERLAFVLHDMFAMPFDEIAPIVGKSETATRQLASRARRRIQGPPVLTSADLKRNRSVVDAFLAASRNGDFDGLVAALDPDVVLRQEQASGTRIVRGAHKVASGAIAFSSRSRFADVAMINGHIGLIAAPRGRLMVAMEFAFSDVGISEIKITTDPAQLRELDLAVIDYEMPLD